jgi:hypothetical protein
MKMIDIINQLKMVLPKYSSSFADLINVSSIAVSGGIATVSTSKPHGLVAGDEVIMSSVKTCTFISDMSKDGNIVTITTAEEHDLTLNWHSEVELHGFTDPDWNSTFQLVNVPDRTTFCIRTTLEPVDEEDLTGSECLLEIRNDGVNGRFEVKSATARSFTVKDIIFDGTYIEGTVQSGIRIAGAVTVDHALQQYTEQELSDLWAFIVMDNMNVSRDKSSSSDAIATKMIADELRLRLIDGFQIVLVKNVVNDQGAVAAVDLFRHDLLMPILKSIYGVIFDTGLTYSGDFRTVMTGAEFVDFNLASFAFTYKFQVVADITDEDSCEESDSMAFKKILLEEVVNGNVDLPMVSEIELTE